MKSQLLTPLTRFGRTIAALSLISTFLVFFTYCSKDKEKTKTDQLQQKWDHFTIATATFDKSTGQPVDVFDPTNPRSELPGEYYHFQNNGILNVHFHGNYTDYPYTFSETDMTLEFNGLKYIILELTDSTLHLFRKYDLAGGNQYKEVTFNMWR